MKCDVGCALDVTVAVGFGGKLGTKADGV